MLFPQSCLNEKVNYTELQGNRSRIHFTRLTLVLTSSVVTCLVCSGIKIVFIKINANTNCEVGHPLSCNSRRRRVKYLSIGNTTHDKF